MTTSEPAINSASPITPEQLTEAQALGQKLGLLIAGLPITEAEKEAFFTVLPEMSVEQLIRLSTVLETRYLHSATTAVKDQLVNDLEQIDADYNNKVAQADVQALQAMKAVEKQLRPGS